MLLRKCVAEGIGTALLLATVIGSGIMGERLAGGNVSIALLANTIATGAGLVTRRRQRVQRSLTTDPSVGKSDVVEPSRLLPA